MSGGLQKAGLQTHDFLLMESGEPRKDLLAAGRQRDKYVASITRIVNFADQAAPRGSIGEFHDGVMTLLQELSQFGDGGFLAAGVAGDAKQQLVLLRRDATSPSSLFAEAQEFAQCVAKRGKMANRFLKRIAVCQMLIGRARHVQE
ncbi:MAG TPA: hypothetical protein VIY66_10855 [Candidatus Acidoferrales bacterium]